jgi:predicted TIM-barrel fold metal-dependent hydrolase
VYIDCHAHWLPPQLAQALRKRRSAPRIELTAHGERLVAYHGGRPFDRQLGDIDFRLELMHRHRIARQVLSLPGLFGVDCLPLEESLSLVIAFNDAAADACRANRERFSALAALPLADIEAACAELKRAHTLGLRGAILPAAAFVSFDAAEPLRPLFAAGARLRSHFFIHPGPLQPQPERKLPRIGADNAWQRHIVLETQAVLSAAVTTLNLSDFLVPYPEVTVQVANLGGAIPFLIERMDEVCRQQMNGAALPSSRMQRCYVDTASFGPRAVELAVACFGADRVLLGTDCPIFDMQRMLDSIAGTHLDEHARSLITSVNARRLLNID